MPIVKFRQFGDRPAPQQIRVTVPGWAGAKEPGPTATTNNPGIACRFPKARATASSWFILTTSSSA